ncbi:hypothetical protein Tco_1157486 [Tanacetum coccineum]
MWSLDYLSISVPSKGRYKTTHPSSNFIKSLIQVPRQGQVTHTKNKKTIIVDKNEILSREIQPHMKPWVDIIRENAICLGGHRDHVFACLCHMLYCIETSTPYNLAFFILKRMEKTQNKPKKLLPYEMLLTRLFKHVVSVFSELAIDQYLSHDRMLDDPWSSFPLFLSSSSSSNHPTMNSTQAFSSNPFKKINLTIIPPRQLFINISSDEDVTTTPSPTTNFSSPTPPNAPSKTPSTNQTSSSQENASSSFQSKL